MNIITRIESLRAREHEATVALIVALLECDRSEAHIARGYSSMWEFLVRHLNYSNAAASRRYKAMKCAKKFPQILDMLRKHETNLSALAQAEATLAKVADPHELLAEMRGKSQRQVEEALARRNPQPKKRERIRRMTVKPAAGPTARPASDQELFTQPTSAPEVRTLVHASSAAEQASHPTSAPEVEDRVHISFSVTAATYEEFERAKAILSRKLPQGVTVEAAFEELLAVYLKQKAPKSPKKTKSPKKSSAATATSPLQLPTTTRHIPAAMRRAVFERDDHRCTFIGDEGHRCGSDHDVEVDHIQPWVLGGRHTVENLRLLCAKHNRHRAKQSFGEPSAHYLVADPLPHRNSAWPELWDLREPRSSADLENHWSRVAPGL